MPPQIRFADILLLRYEVPGFDTLSLRQKKLVYYLSEAVLSGRDILWDQNCRFNLPIRRMLETVYNSIASQETASSDESENSEVSAFLTYMRQVWFANGIHHHYSMDKFHPAFSETFLRKQLTAIGYPIDEGLLRAIFDPTFLPKRVNQADGADLLLTSAMNYYAPGITQQEAEQFYAEMKATFLHDNRSLHEPSDCSPSQPLPPCPPSFGLNSRLERDADGKLCERTWKSGGMYGTAIDRIIYWLEKAATVAESEQQRSVIAKLVAFYRTGDLHTFDLYTILWVQDILGDIDFTNGFTEVYGDPIGLKASWEGYVNIRDVQATERTRRLSENAQWFEDNSPVDPRFKKRECRGISARVVNVATLGGDLYPASAIGINLPNSDYVRKHYGSKSVTLGNLTAAYAQAARGNGFYEEFVHPDELSIINSPLSIRLDDLHTDLHECLGHGSGQLLPGVDPDSLGSYGSTIEEARADLFALYYIADTKMVELGLVPDGEAYRSQYYTYMMNGLMTQLVRIQPGQQIEEAHMRNRALIARWLLENSGAMELIKLSHPLTLSSSNTASGAPTECPIAHYLHISSYPALRQAIGKLLAEVQCIKSEGDREAARQLVETYGIQVDPALHAEVLERYRRLNIAPYKGFINPRLTPIYNTEGEITDVTISYDETYDQQMLRYGRDYSTLATD